MMNPEKIIEVREQQAIKDKTKQETAKAIFNDLEKEEVSDEIDFILLKEKYNKLKKKWCGDKK